MVFQNKSVSWKSHRAIAQGATKNPREYYRGRSGLLPHSQVSRCDSKESQGGVASVGASPWGLLHPKWLVWRSGSQERLGCPKSGHEYPGSGHGCPDGVELVLGLHQECPGVVKLVMGLHHVSQGGKQGEFRDGEANIWDSPCKFQW